jgi:hypothetical protein
MGSSFILPSLALGLWTGEKVNTAHQARMQQRHMEGQERQAKREAQQAEQEAIAKNDARNKRYAGMKQNLFSGDYSNLAGSATGGNLIQ